MISIAAGGAHSACITSAGELYTWGKGRYGRLGHGDSEDQSKPKMVGSIFEPTLLFVLDSILRYILHVLCYVCFVMSLFVCLLMLLSCA